MKKINSDRMLVSIICNIATNYKVLKLPDESIKIINKNIGDVIQIISTSVLPELLVDLDDLKITQDVEDRAIHYVLVEKTIETCNGDLPTDRFQQKIRIEEIDDLLYYMIGELKITCYK